MTGSAPSAEERVAILHRALTEHPTAAIAAMDDDGLITAIPADLPVAGCVVIEKRWLVEMVVASDRLQIATAWEALRRDGISRVSVTFRNGLRAEIHWIDVRERYGVYVAVVASDDGTVVDFANVVRHRRGPASIRSRAPQRGRQCHRRRPGHLPSRRLVERRAHRGTDNRSHPPRRPGAGDRELARDPRGAVRRDPLAWEAPARPTESTSGSSSRTATVSMIRSTAQCARRCSTSPTRWRCTTPSAAARPGFAGWPRPCRSVSPRSTAIARSSTRTGPSPASWAPTKRSTIGAAFAATSDEERQRLETAIDAALERDEDAEVEISIRARPDESRVIHVIARPLNKRPDRSVNAIIVVADVTDRTTMRNELERRANFDALTRCYNRSTILSHARGATRIAARLEPESR